MQHLMMETFLRTILSALARPRLALRIAIVGVFALGGCTSTATGKLCPLEPPKANWAESDNFLLPDGCRVVGRSGNATQQIACDDGRTGYTFN